MDEVSKLIISGMGTAITGLVIVIRILWAKISEERKEAERVKAEILDLYKKKVDELEQFRNMVESRKGDAS